jgi:assimilatory nitrate reductase catalytic subunit
MEMATIQTHCPFCSIACGLSISLDLFGRPKQVEPNYNFTHNRGALCPRGLLSLEWMRHQERLKKPLIREKNGFREASWSEALQKIASVFRSLIENYGPTSIAFYASSRLSNETLYLFKKLGYEVIKTPHIDFNDRLGVASARAAYSLSLGSSEPPNPLTDLLATNLVLIIGADPCSCHPVLMRYVFDARERGAKIVTIDPRKTQTARMADLHIQIKPGTDVAFLNGALNQLIISGLIDRDFIVARTKGFDSVQEAVSKYTPARVAEITGVKEEQLRAFARLYAQSPTAMVIHSRGLEQHQKGVSAVLACINLALATGKVGKRGCGFLPLMGHVSGVTSYPNPSSYGLKEGFTVYEMIEAAYRREIRGMYILASNPVVSLPETGFVVDALQKLDLLVVQDVFLTETAKLAHVILPGSTLYESEGTINAVDGRRVKLKRAFNTPKDAKEDWKIICQLAKILGANQGFEYGSAEEVLDELSSHLKETIIRRDIDEQGLAVVGDPLVSDKIEKKRLYGDSFAHDDGLAAFYMVEYAEPAELTSTEYPLLLITFKTPYHFLTSSETGRIDFFKQKCPKPYLEIHPATAEKLGISQGDRVVVRSKAGKVEAVAEVTDTIREDCVAMPMHWFKEGWVNLVVPKHFDPISKIPNYKAIPVCVERK